MDFSLYESACASSPYDKSCVMSMYAHKHCSIPTCREILAGVGGGGDDGRGISGYEDDHGNAARLCVECGDETFVLCASCAAQDPRCGACRAQATCNPATCAECRLGAA